MKKTIVFVILILFAFNLTSQILPLYLPTDSLIAWYPFNGNSDDESPSGLNLTNNGALLSPNRHGDALAAYSFNGTSSSYLSINNPANNLLDGHQGCFSISLWFKTSSSGIRTLINKRRMIGGNNHEGYSVFFDGGKPRFHVADVNENHTLCNGTNSFSDNQWHHLVVIRDVIKDSLFIYVDAQLEASKKNQCTGTINTIGDFYVGKWEFYNQYAYNGVLDDIGFWKKALTKLEIKSLYQSCENEIVAQPISQNAAWGDTIFFTFHYTDTTESFRWQSNIGFGFQNLENASQYSGVNTSTLTIANINQFNNSQIFRCIIGNGICADTTDTVMLSVSQYIDTKEITSSNTGISIYPNPTSGIITVESKAPFSNVEIYSANGNQLCQYRGVDAQKVRFRISSEPGLYFLVFRSIDGTILTRKVIVN